MSTKTPVELRGYPNDQYINLKFKSLTGPMSASRKNSAAVNAAAAAATTAAAVVCVMLGSYYYVWKTRKAQTTTKFRIVSLNPSTTQTLYDLGLADFVVGRTRYCPSHPDHQVDDSGSSSIKKRRRVVNIPKVGGAKDVDWDKIRTLEPTHILFNMEENVYTELSIAQSICNNTIFHTPVNIQESRDSVELLGRTFHATDQARMIVHDIDDALHQLQESIKKNKSSFTYLYFIWHVPEQRLAGGGTFIHEMLSAAGGINVAAQLSKERYPLLSTCLNNIKKEGNSQQEEEPLLVADYCLLSTEPFPFKEHHIKDYQHFGRRATKIINGEMVCWHGSRMAQGLRYLDSFFSTLQ